MPEEDQQLLSHSFPTTVSPTLDRKIEEIERIVDRVLAKSADRVLEESEAAHAL